MKSTINNLDISALKDLLIVLSLDTGLVIATTISKFSTVITVSLFIYLHGIWVIPQYKLCPLLLQVYYGSISSLHSLHWSRLHQHPLKALSPWPYLGLQQLLLFCLFSICWDIWPQCWSFFSFSHSFLFSPTLPPIPIQIYCPVKLFINVQERSFYLYKLISNITIYFSFELLY